MHVTSLAGARARSRKEPMKSQFSRAGGALAALAVGAGLALAPTAAQAATTPQAGSAASWLADQLPAGTILQTSGFPDYGLTIDFALALVDTGTEAAAVDRIVEALATTPETFSQYTTTVGFDDRADSQVAGATAKLATLVQMTGGDPTSFGGEDLIEDVETVTVDEGASAGRASDISDFGDFSKEGSLRVQQPLIHSSRLEDFAKIFVDGGVIIDQQDAPIYAGV